MISDPTVLIGQIFFFTSLCFGLIFFLYAMKYYLSTILVLLISNGNGTKFLNNEHQQRGTIKSKSKNDQIKKKNRYERLNSNKSEPFVSIHLPLYNEKNVAKRIIQACLDIDYPEFEILVLDDSTDETVDIVKEYGRLKGSPRVKIVHRESRRRGFKGGALAEALNHMDPKTRYVVVFDADFIPPKDIIRQFLPYFDGNNHADSDHRGPNTAIDRLNDEIDVAKVEKGAYEGQRIAAVQGYQLHHLNKNENWITKGVRSEYSGSYMVERVAEEFYGAMKMISGSVFMVRADVMRELGWTTSLTEDWDLTLRLYLSGYKVVYTPFIMAPAEIPSTVRRLVQQRARWAEGHTFSVKKHFWEVVRSPMLTRREKLEFFYLAPYYLQSLFFVVGTLSWGLAEILRPYPPYWTAALGWSLVISNLLAIPLMSLAGLFLERSAREDLRGILSFIAISYIVTPFQAYAALKGLFEKEEGTWIRTFKTGSITNKVLQIKFRRLFGWVLPKGQSKPLRPVAKKDHGHASLPIIAIVLLSALIVYLTATSMSQPTAALEYNTTLTFQYVDPKVTVFGNQTNNVLTHPNFTRLGTTHTDIFNTTAGELKRVFTFYLYGTLNRDYELMGKLRFVFYLYASQNSDVDANIRIRDVGVNGIVGDDVNTSIEGLELGTYPSHPVEVESEPINFKRFSAGDSILVELWLKGNQNDTVYYFDYGSSERRSRIEFPGIVMPEMLLPLMPIAPAIPSLALIIYRRSKTFGSRK